LHREEVKMWKFGNKWAVTLEKKWAYMGRENAHREQVKETHGR
jgi:hypothetical protein